MLGLIVENEKIRLVTIPEFGSRIVSLIFKPTASEFAWHNPRIPISKPNYEKGFEEPVTGFFDCLPTCEACTWKGRKLPFMGDVSSQAWILLRSELNNGVARVETERALSVYPLRVRKELVVKSDSAATALKYTLYNLADEVTEYHYSAHNTMSLPQGTKIILPREVKNVTVGASFHGRVRSGQQVTWPRARVGKRKYVDLSKIGSPCMGSGENMYTSKLKEGWCAAVTPKRELIGFCFPTDRLPYLLIWQNLGGYKGYFHTALEPCTGYPDNLAHAVKKTRAFAQLDPRASVSWTEIIVLADNISSIKRITPEGDILAS